MTVPQPCEVAAGVLGGAPGCHCFAALLGNLCWIFGGSGVGIAAPT